MIIPLMHAINENSSACTTDDADDAAATSLREKSSSHEYCNGCYKLKLRKELWEVSDIIEHDNCIAGANNFSLDQCY